MKNLQNQSSQRLSMKNEIFFLYKKHLNQIKKLIKTKTHKSIELFIKILSSIINSWSQSLYFFYFKISKKKKKNQLKYLKYSTYSANAIILNSIFCKKLVLKFCFFTLQFEAYWQIFKDYLGFFKKSLTFLSYLVDNNKYNNQFGISVLIYLFWVHLNNIFFVSSKEKKRFLNLEDYKKDFKLVKKKRYLILKKSLKLCDYITYKLLLKGLKRTLKTFVDVNNLVQIDDLNSELIVNSHRSFIANFIFKKIPLQKFISCNKNVWQQKKKKNKFISLNLKTRLFLFLAIKYKFPDLKKKNGPRIPKIGHNLSL